MKMTQNGRVPTQPNNYVMWCWFAAATHRCSTPRGL